MNELTFNEPEIVSPVAINEQITRAEIDMQIATARQYPRQIGQCVDTMISMATLNHEIAQSSYYSIPRGGKTIDGPSVRLAETVAMNWQHIRAASRILEIGTDYLIAEGACHDLQNNNLVSVQVRRRITNRDGQRFNDDMINVTAQAASAIAFRNAVFKVVPRNIWEPVYRAARQMAIGDQSTLEERRDKAFDYFETLGVEQSRVLALVNRTGIEEITLKDLGVLIGVATGIRNGELTAKDAFPESTSDASNAIQSAPKQEIQKPVDVEESPIGTVADMAERLKAKAAENEEKKPVAKRGRGRPKKIVEESSDEE